MIELYCDASQKSSRVAVACILATPKVFVDCATEVLDKNIVNSTHGELLALLRGLRLINKHYSTPQDVVVYSDCTSVVDQFRDTVKTGKVQYTRSYYNDWISIRDEIKDHSITVHHTKGHADKRTYHTMCDYMARALLGIELSRLEKETKNDDSNINICI